MFKIKRTGKNNKSYPKNKITKSKDKTKKISEKNYDKNKLITKTTSKSITSNRSNSSSNNSSINKSKISKKKEKEKKVNEPKIKEEKKIDEELIKQQYKIIKDFLIPILKEQNAKELVSCYNKMAKVEKKFKTKSKVISLRNKPILEYSFVTGKSKNKLKIPLFQVMTPTQFKNHVEKQNKERTTTINRPCKNSSTTNINNLNSSEARKRNSNNKITSMEFSGPFNSINGKNDIRSSLMAYNSSTRNNKENTSKINNNTNGINNQNKSIKKKNEKRSKTPPLYLRINEVRKKHDEEMEKLRKKYEYNYKKINNNKTNSITKEDDNSFSEESGVSSSIISRNQSQTRNDFEKWYDYEKTWQKMKDMKLNIIKSELEENKICQNIYNKQQETFKPKINKNSENLLLKKYDGDFYIRLKDYQKNKERKANMLKQKLKPNFKPFVNVNYNINKEYYLYMKYDQKKINKDLNVFLEKN